MISIRKFVYAALLAATTVIAAPGLASAQEAAHGHFTLTHDVHWGNARVPAGDYEFSFDPNNIAPILTLTKLCGVRTGFILLVPSTEHTKPSAISRILLESSSEGSYVSAMQLPESGMTLHFALPPHVGEKQMARAAGAPATLGQ